MARYTDADCKLCRREGEKLFLKGERCLGEKCGIERHNTPPGQHGGGRRRPKRTDYGIQLREKQKVKRIYGLLERQFRKYFEMAERQPGITGRNLIELLERRLDNMVYRLGCAASRSQARQLVNHGHFLVNGRRVSIPSYLVEEDDTISVAEKSKDLRIIRDNVETAEQRGIPAWVEFDPGTLTGKVLRTSIRDELALPVQEQLIVDLYSR